MVQGDGEEDRAKSIQVAKEDKTQSLAATFVDAKGAARYTVKFLAIFLKRLGIDKAVMKSDGEHSIVALKDAAAPGATIEAIAEESTVREHQANGMVENAIREINNARVLRSALEEPVGKELGNGDPVSAWLPRLAADVMNRYKRGPDGRKPELARHGESLS